MIESDHKEVGWYWYLGSCGIIGRVILIIVHVFAICDDACTPLIT